MVLHHLTGLGRDRLSVFPNKILRRIFGPKRYEINRWRMFYKEELHILYYSPNLVKLIKSKRLRWEGHEAGMEDCSCYFKFLASKPTGKKLLGRPRRR
jgi:hypothetical protein